jgi:hypothetical protein
MEVRDRNASSLHREQEVDREASKGSYLSCNFQEECHREPREGTA